MDAASELGVVRGPTHGESFAARLKSVFPRASRCLPRRSQYSSACRRANRTRSEHPYIEKYRPGYPRYSALLATHKSFHFCRRFTQIRIRLLLYKQDKLSFLEQQLEKVDAEETAVLFLGSHRRDGNKQRGSLLSEIDTALADYDALVERNHWMLSFENAKQREILSLRNWTNDNACLARDETAYLDHNQDLITLSSSSDRAIGKLQNWVENFLIVLRKRFGTELHQGISQDPHVHVFSNSLLKGSARALLMPLIIFLLLVPMVICNELSSLGLRILTILIFITIFLLTLSGLIRARTMEMFVAGATYTTVLVVFVSGTSLYQMQ